MSLRLEEFNSLNKEIFESLIQKNEKVFQSFIDRLDNLQNPEMIIFKEFMSVVFSYLDIEQFNFMTFYPAIISKKEEYKDVINLVLNKYGNDSNYDELNEIYNEWRKLIHTIGYLINNKFSEYLNILPVKINQEKEDKHRKKELAELENMENMISNL